MDYKSTRDQSVRVKSAQAISMGISKDGGLFVPCSIPAISKEDIESISKMSYIEAAEFILSLYLDDYNKEDLHRCVTGAYTGTFDNNMPAPLYALKDGVYILELWHGPTCAFKDLALQLLPYLLSTASEMTSKGKTKVILVATSGDTGKAALEGFSGVEGTKIITFYPEDGVSNMQKLQMITTLGDNVSVCAIKGNFDDAQTGVKSIFTNDDIIDILEKNNMQFSSANSINWGRLVPQIVYYIYSYAQLVKNSSVSNGDKVNFVVPTGNFGNILAAFYAKEMGIPVNKLICASNQNNILTDFLRTGVYDRNRPFYTTLSPSMDILISSNLERLLYHISPDKVKGWMQSLSDTGRYEVDNETLAKLKDIFYAASCDDIETSNTIHDTFKTYDYLCDTHTAVAVNVYNQYVTETQDNSVSVIASTASPFKFSRGVYEAITGNKTDGDEFEVCDALSKKSGVQIPQPILSLANMTPRFNNSCQKEEMPQKVLEMLGL